MPQPASLSGPGDAAQAHAAARWRGEPRFSISPRRRTASRWRHRLRRRWRETRALSFIVGHELIRTDVLDVAAGLSFWSMLSMVPLLMAVSALLSVLRIPGLLPQLLGVLAMLVPADSLAMVEKMVGGLLTPHRGMLSFGLLIYVWSTTSGFTALITALNVAYDVTTPRAVAAGPAAGADSGVHERGTADGLAAGAARRAGFRAFFGDGRSGAGVVGKNVAADPGGDGVCGFRGGAGAGVFSCAETQATVYVDTAGRDCGDCAVVCRIGGAGVLSESFCALFAVVWREWAR